jgi:hypothetical protein
MLRADDIQTRPRIAFNTTRRRRLRDDAIRFGWKRHEIYKPDRVGVGVSVPPGSELDQSLPPICIVVIEPRKGYFTAGFSLFHLCNLFPADLDAGNHRLLLIRARGSFYLSNCPL